MLRDLQESDAAACGSIVGATALWQRYGLTAERAAALLTAARRSGDVLLVEDDGGVLGFAWVDLRGTFGRAPYLRLLAVDPSRRGRGIGARLLEAVEQRAAGVADRCYLLVSDFNERAQSFYRRAGWEEAGRLPELAIPGVSEVLMVKRVRAPR
jgi:GNAT superfamily N-acetyltransferase